MLYERRKTRAIEELSGIQSAAPILRLLHRSHAFVNRSAWAQRFRWRIPDPDRSFDTRRWWTIVAATGVILAALYLLWAYQRVLHGEPTTQDQKPLT